jgi:hypothetical protein
VEVGALVSYFKGNVHKRVVMQTRFDVSVGAVAWYSRLEQVVSEVHCRSDVVVGAVDWN